MNTVPSHRKSERSRQNWLFLVPLLALLFWRLVTFRPAPAGSADLLVQLLGLAALGGGIWVRVCARQWKAERAHDGLVTDGPYGWVRHPLYVASFLIGLGICLMLRDAVLLAAFVAAFWWSHALVIRREEAALEALFGEEYRRYRSRVPGFVPALSGPQRQEPFVPRRLSEAVTREGDAICIWLALPLIVSLARDLASGTASPGWLALALFGIGCLAAFWVRLKLDYRALIRRERQGAPTRSRRAA